MRTKATRYGTYIEKIPGPHYDLYKIQSEGSARQSKELLITAHGAAMAAAAEPENSLYVNTGLAARRELPPPIPSRGLPNHRAAADARMSLMFPARSTFTPRVPLSYFVDHHESLASEKDSTMRRIVELRAVAIETYPASREQTDYDLADVSGNSAQYAGTILPRNDFIKALLFECQFAFESSAVGDLLAQSMQSYGSYAIVTEVPDILMVTGVTKLSAVLASPPVAHYQRVIGAFCRAVHHAPVRHQRAHAVEVSGIPDVLDMRDLETRVVQCMLDIGRWNGPIPAAQSLVGRPLPPAKPQRRV